ncbi:Bro4 [Heliothis virescens ascovirus 3g]|uniref:Bro4 n=1 Tax=Heliothis virescens ascovirus 3g TaxID=1246651 RepID=K4NY04_9VIRU|nr:Bro4 [Heliothis virescens ascovirus 3g]AFV50295.1 Bro4 [Heliothis virescens ascovirus 3g]
MCESSRIKCINYACLFQSLSSSALRSVLIVYSALESASVISCCFWLVNFNYFKMSSVKFQFNNQELEVISVRDDNDQLWMLANPFASLLTYSRPNDAIRNHVTNRNWRNFDNLQKFTDTMFSSLHPSSRFINKSGLLELVIKSKMRYADEFRYWLVNELFPSLKIDALDDFAVWRNDPTNRQTLEEQLPRYDDQIEPGCVYVITNDLYEPLHLYKIGYTCNLNDRLSELNVASAYDFRPVFVVPTKKCRQLESILHSKYEGQRFRREFFTLNEDNFIGLIKLCSDFVTNCIE